MNESPLFRRPDGRPLLSNHHLETARGAYRVKVTVDAGGKYVGRRITIPLRTRDEELAKHMRDAAIEALTRASVVCRHIVMTDETDIFEDESGACDNSLNCEIQQSPDSLT
jgi:hypothetical protein